MGKSRAVIDWKKTNEKASLVHNLNLYTNSFCLQRAGLEIWMKVAARAARWKGGRHGAGTENVLSP